MSVMQGIKRSICRRTRTLGVAAGLAAAAAFWGSSTAPAGGAPRPAGNPPTTQPDVLAPPAPPPVSDRAFDDGRPAPGGERGGMFRGERGGDRGDRGDRSGGPRRGGDPRPPFFQPLSDEEFPAAVEFMREHMPATYAIWETLPEQLRNRRVFPPRLHASFRLVLEARENGDEEMAELILRQLRLRDEFLNEIVERRSRGEPREAIREALVEKTREIIEANLDQRELRLRMMEKRLGEERERIERDRANPDDLLESQMNTLIDDSRRFLMVLERGPSTQPGGGRDDEPRGGGGRDHSPRAKD